MKFIGVMAFLVATAKPLHVLKPQGIVEAGRYLNIANLSASSLFAAIVTALASVEIVHYFTNYNITIKMPAGVPPEVANSFAGLFPEAVVLILFWLVRQVLGFNIATFLNSLLMPLKGVLAGNSLGGGILTNSLHYDFLDAGYSRNSDYGSDYSSFLGNGNCQKYDRISSRN